MCVRGCVYMSVSDFLPGRRELVKNTPASHPLWFNSQACQEALYSGVGFQLLTVVSAPSTDLFPFCLTSPCLQSSYQVPFPVKYN